MIKKIYDRIWALAMGIPQYCIDPSKEYALFTNWDDLNLRLVITA